MSAPSPDGRIPASSDEGYTIRLPKIRLPIKGNRTYALALAIGGVALWILVAKTRGIPLDLSQLPTIIDSLMSGDSFTFLAPLLAGQIAAHRSGVKGTEARLTTQVQALKDLVAGALGAPAPEIPEEKLARLKAIREEAQQLQAEILTTGKVSS